MDAHQARGGAFTPSGGAQQLSAAQQYHDQYPQQQQQQEQQPQQLCVAPLLQGPFLPGYEAVAVPPGTPNFGLQVGFGPS